MMRTRIIAAVLVATGATLLAAAPAGADARGGIKDLRLNLVSLDFGKVDGNTVRFSAGTGPKDGPIPNSAEYAVGNREQSLTYRLGRDGQYLKNNRITADFGEFGSVEGRIRITGKGDGGKGCSMPFIRRPVIFTGQVKLDAEDGVASISERKVKGELLTAPNPACDLERSDPALQREDPSKRDVLTACTGEAHYYAEGGRTGVRHVAYASEAVDGVGVSRYASVSTSADTFERIKDLTKATVDPGGPFNGAGDYADGELTGDLTVDFLGLPDPVALTPAKASLRQGRFGDKCSQIG